MPFVKGDILLPSTLVAKKDWLKGLHHPAVVWDEIFDGSTDFTGIMLTHTPPTKRFTNVLMAANHFQNGYKVVFSKTHFVNQRFIKFYDWGPFELVGKLTIEGIAFIDAHLSQNSPSIEFLEYRNSMIA
ncbi:MAG: hypothetical protein JNL40_07435 [Cyclobacteriaceae bacterium]|nr:hypothetical protein [Cyclobacteriaceae bacterium]